MCLAGYQYVPFFKSLVGLGWGSNSQPARLAAFIFIFIIVLFIVFVIFVIFHFHKKYFKYLRVSSQEFMQISYLKIEDWY